VKRIGTYSIVLFLISILTACGGSSNEDLKEYIKMVKAKPAGKIDELPTYPPYETFIYSSAGIRSPFDRPVDIKQRTIAKANSNVRPDFNRTKEYLESFDISALSMVGVVRWDSKLYALIHDNNGGVTRVLPGNYLGKNYGRIVHIDNNKVELIEIVSDGLDGWVERPRVLTLVEKD